MSILDRLGLSRQRFDTLAVPAAIVSPFAQPGNLEGLIAADIFDPEVLNKLPLTREAAIGIPAVSKARNLLVASVAKFPLVALRGDEVLDSKQQPAWCYRTNTSVPPYSRMVWTVDDGIFWGCSLWVVERGADDVILDAEWVPQKDWQITEGVISVRDTPLAPRDYILFDFPFEGLLNIAGRTLRGAIDTEAAWVGRVRNPIPALELHQTDDTLDEAGVKPFVEAWSKARRSDNGAIGYTPPSIELKTHGEVSADLMIEGRNAIRTDVGSFLNVRASMLDGTIGVDSLTYTTQETERNAFYDFDLPFWTDYIEARLSEDDVVPRGQRIRFDKYDIYNTPAPTGRPVED